MIKIYKYVLLDILKNRILLVYALLLFLMSFAVFSIEDTSSKGVLSMLNVVLMIVPLVSIIFSTIYFYNSSEFIELLLAQPLKRKTIWLAFFGGIVSSLEIAFLLGAGFVTLVASFSWTSVLLVITGMLLTAVFASIATLAAVYTRDKAKGIGAAILLWLYFSIIFDGLLMFLLFQFSDYPIEHYMVGFSMLNPIDLSRILILMKLDVSALMGYTGALFREFFGSIYGMIIAFGVLLLWVIIPIMASLIKFKRKDI